MISSDEDAHKFSTESHSIFKISKRETYDVFVFHSSEPSEVSFVKSELAPALKGRVLLSGELPLGQTILEALEEGISSSRVSIVVLSPAFLLESWAAFGEVLASHAAVTSGLIVPLILKDCQLPKRLSIRVHLDCRDPAHRPEAFKRLRNLIFPAVQQAEVAEQLLQPVEEQAAVESQEQIVTSIDSTQESSFKKASVDIGILTIRDDEFRALLEVFPNKAGFVKGKSRDYALRYANAGGDHKYTVALLRQAEQGNGEAQEATRDLIEDLAPRLILVVGIAGGMPSDDVKLGDVVLSTRIIDFTVEARNSDQAVTYASTGGAIAKELSNSIINLAAREDELGEWTRGLPTFPDIKWTLKGQLYGPPDWQRKLRSNLESHYGKYSTPRAPRFIAGSIASSDRLVKDPALIIPWLTTSRNLLAVEMESGGVFRAARERCSMLAIRGISDIVGLKRSDGWTKYACASAAAFTRAFLQTRPIALTEQLDPP